MISDKVDVHNFSISEKRFEMTFKDVLTIISNIYPSNKLGTYIPYKMTDLFKFASFGYRADMILKP